MRPAIDSASADVGAAMNGDRGAAPRQLERDRRAGARRGAGDESDLAREGNAIRSRIDELGPDRLGLRLVEILLVQLRN